AAALLVKKREGKALSDEEIRYLVDGFCRGEVADYQMSALAMAICLRGMDLREITTLTQAMLASGDSLPRSASSDRPRVDKHSTGGLGDKVSLILAPLLAACGADVPMISGRGLGLTGGTLDKLEAIEGFQTQLDGSRSQKILREVGVFIMGATERIAPADRRLYALRDVTGTVESVPLITASILSKKLAANLDALVMDVKVGSGAFMKTLEQATELAHTIVGVGDQAGLSTTAILSDMDQPLGNAIGNAIEVNEALDVLRGDGPIDVRDLTVELCADLLVQVKLTPTRTQARQQLERALDSGLAMERFEKMVAAQGGRLRRPLAVAPPRPVTAPQGGYLERLDCTAVGQAVVAMGGGRRRTGDAIDPSVGVSVQLRIGDRVETGQSVLTVHGRPGAIDGQIERLEQAFRIVPRPVQPRQLILQRL
ncbi:MAG: thymidine phosphorylase, partial [Pirellulales bacterium]|nr:thymidine phosphorylase [Pirellulales bacterium]